MFVAISVARDLMLYTPSAGRVQENAQEDVPAAGVQSAPPFVDTSTVETPEPEPSVEVPLIEYVPSAGGCINPPIGLVMDEDGLVASTVTVIPSPGSSVLVALSTARDFIV
jgi:hypothetical protein